MCSPFFGILGLKSDSVEEFEERSIRFFLVQGFVGLIFSYYLLQMGPKKKVQDDDDSTEKLMRIYRKKCEELGVTPSKLFRTKVE
jgi:hypothetical protein